MDYDYILCECPLESLVKLVEGLEPLYDIKIARDPGIGLTMIKAEDTVEKQPFYLGEALTTTCEVVIGQVTGYGIVLEDQPQRAYCIAVLDALAQMKDERWPQIEQFFQTAKNNIDKKALEEQHRVLKTKVDFNVF